MSDPAKNLDDPNNQNFDDPNENIDPNENLEPQDQVIDEPEFSESELQARSLGWKPKDEFGGDPDDWNTHRGFLKNRELIESSKALRANQDRMESEFNRRLDGVNKIHEQSLNLKIEELKNTRDSAAEEADMDTYHAANKQLEELNKPTVEDQPQMSPQDLMVAVVNQPVTQTFINENQWIKGDGPKAVYGQKVFADWIAANSNNTTAMIEDGLNLVKQSVNNAFPQTNPNLNNAQQMSERGQGSRKTPQRNSLTIADLTPAERGIWRSMGNTWKDEADFLQSVADTRKGE